MRRDDICLYLNPGDRAQLQAPVADRNTPRKLVWRAGIVLTTADGHGTFAIMRRAGTSKPTVQRWQERYLDEGVAGLKRDRTQPGLPLKKSRAATVTHDYKRHGTTTLFAALDVKSGMVIGECLPRHRAKEFLRFLRRIDRSVPGSREVHLVLDNYATHRTPEVKAWLKKHPRFKLHFTPTGASWLNMVERFFAEITSKRIRRSSYSSVDDPEASIYDCLLQHNAKPKTFTWTKSAENILARERRALNTFDEIRGNR